MCAECGKGTVARPSRCPTLHWHLHMITATLTLTLTLEVCVCVCVQDSEATNLITVTWYNWLHCVTSSFSTYRYGHWLPCFLITKERCICVCASRLLSRHISLLKHFFHIAQYLFDGIILLITSFQIRPLITEAVVLLLQQNHLVIYVLVRSWTLKDGIT